MPTDTHADRQTHRHFFFAISGVRGFAKRSAKNLAGLNFDVVFLPSITLIFRFAAVKSSEQARASANRVGGLEGRERCSGLGVFGCKPEAQSNAGKTMAAELFKINYSVSKRKAVSQRVLELSCRQTDKQTNNAFYLRRSTGFAFRSANKRYFRENK